MARQALTIAARHPQPPSFNGTPTTWRVLCDLYPAAESPEVVLAVLDYCGARKLDPMKKPVHVVPMYNSRLRRKVQVVMQGINEIETTASRTGRWAGMDAAEWGPNVTRTFRGQMENEDGSAASTECVLTFPEWCRVTVYKLIGTQRYAFTEQLWWLEAYGRAGFRTEVPNHRWQTAPRQMLHKSTKAATLRAAFPEEGLGYSAEEMDGREVEGGVTIEGTAERGAAEDYGNEAEDDQPEPPAQAALNGAAHAEQPPAEPGPPPTITERLSAEANSTAWLKLFFSLTRAAASIEELHEIAGHPWTVDALAKAPSLIRERMNDELRRAHDRISPPATEPPAAEPEPPAQAPAPPEPGAAQPATDDETLPLIAEIETMDLARLDSLATDNEWKWRTLNLFPTDMDRVDEALGNRRRELTPKKEAGP